MKSLLSGGVESRRHALVAASSSEQSSDFLSRRTARSERLGTTAISDEGQVRRGSVRPAQLILAALLGLAIGAHARLWQHADFRALAHATAQYVAREVTENGLPLPGWRGYRDGWRDGQQAALRVQLRDVEERP